MQTFCFKKYNCHLNLHSTDTSAQPPCLYLCYIQSEQPPNTCHLMLTGYKVFYEGWDQSSWLDIVWRKSTSKHCFRALIEDVSSDAPVATHFVENNPGIISMRQPSPPVGVSSGSISIDLHTINSLFCTTVQPSVIYLWNMHMCWSSKESLTTSRLL